MEACSNKAMSITNMLLDLASTIGSSKSAKGKGKARVRDEDDFLDRFGSLIVEPMDQLFERAAARSLLYSMLRISQSRSSSSSGRSITQMASCGLLLCDISSTRVYH
ncbi:hypothetical protein BJY52DRAFT_1321730 [Lactarius psammicola]|nr:hypothetical protein BJY52DRAFT_1321730 [Lactarius psammicola]